MNRELRIGDKVKITATIIDDGQEHHPPCCIANRGDIVLVRQICGSSLFVSHEENPNTFIIRDGEYRKDW